MKVYKKGSLTLPINLLRKNNIDEGDIFTLIDMGDGSFLLTPRVSEVNCRAKRISEIFEEEDLSSDDLLTGLDGECQQYCQEHSAED